MIQNTNVHFVGKMLEALLVVQVVHIVTGSAGCTHSYWYCRWYTYLLVVQVVHIVTGSAGGTHSYW